MLDITPALRELLISLAILAGSYLGARLVSYLFGAVLARAAARTRTSLDDYLIAAIKGPLTYALFLLGAYLAVHRFPLTEWWRSEADVWLFVVGIGLLTVALVRSYGALIRWFSSQSALAAEGGPAREFGPLLGKVGKVFIVVIGVAAVFRRFGVDASSLLVSLGVGSLAIGLAAQDTLANMFAGFALMLDRPFRIGDRIVLASGEVGDVETIGMRATRIRTLDETLLVIPNSILVKERLINRSQPSREITTRIEVAVAFGSDLAAVKAILEHSALASPYTIPERPPVAVVARFSEFAIILTLIFWARDYTEQHLATSTTLEEIHNRFRAAGIEIPFPTRRVIEV